LLLAAFVYVFLGTCGTFRHWQIYNAYFDLQAEGFRHGHLSIAASPSRELLSKANPRDWSYQNLWLFDVSLYRDKYYLYWGPFPAIVQALVKSALRIRGIIGDQYLVFGFFLSAATCGALILNRMARLLDVPRTLLALGILAFAFANPAPYLVGNAGVYQAAVGAGQACLLAGVAMAFCAVWHAQSGHPQRLRLVWAGVAWALALASRVSLAPAIALLMMTTVLTTSLSSRWDWKRFVGEAASLGIPVACGFLALLLYNKARFDSWFEFGTSKQLTTYPFRFSPKYFAINAYSYLLKPYETSCRFPFVLEYWDIAARGIPASMKVPDGYLLREPVVGLLRVVPCAWLLPIPVALTLGGAWTKVSGASGSKPEGLGGCPFHVYAFCTVSFAIAGTVTAVAQLGLYMATMRYLADVTSGLVLLGILGAWTLRAVLRDSAWMRRAASGLSGGLCIATIVFGLLLGYQGYGMNFHVYNPDLHTKIVRALSVCK
jgi:hypothetical protein